MRYLVLVFLCLGTIVAYLQRLALSPATKLIEADLGFGPDDMGLVLTAWYCGYAVFQLPSGWIADRMGAKHALIAFSLTWSGLTAMAGLSRNREELLLWWGLMGCAQAGIFPAATKMIGVAFPRNLQAFASGCLGGCMSLGGAVAQGLTPRLYAFASWQEVLLIYAIPGLAWAILFAVSVFPPRVPNTAIIAPPTPTPAAAPWVTLFTDGQMLLLCAQQLFRAGAMVFFYTWLPRYLRETRGLTEAEVGTLAYWPLLAGACGGFVGGILSDLILEQTQSLRLARQGLACITMLICTLTALVVFFVRDTTLAVVLLSLGSFSGTAGGVSSYATAIAYGGKNVARVFATMNMSGNIGGSIFPFAVGTLVAATGNWHLAVLVFASLFAACGVCWMFLNPQGTLFPETDA